MLQTMHDVMTCTESADRNRKTHREQLERPFKIRTVLRPIETTAKGDSGEEIPPSWRGFDWVLVSQHDDRWIRPTNGDGNLAQP